MLAHDGAVFLFDPGLVVLAIRARAGELDAVTQAILDHRLVDKFATVVDIQGPKRKRQRQSDTFQSLHQQTAFSHDQRRTLGPSARDVGEHKAIDVASSVHLPAVCNEIHLHAPRWRLVPVGEGPYRYAA